MPKKLKNSVHYLPYALYAALTVLVMVPLYRGGYVFLLDMVFAPHVALPAIINGIIPSNYPVVAFIKLLSFFIDVSVIEKIILSLELFLPAVFMYRLAKRLLKSASEISTEGWAIIAGLFYSFNPWTYERFLSGQWLVMLGYAFFPLAALWLWQAFECPEQSERVHRRRIIKFAVLFALYPIVSLHFGYFMTAFVGVFAAVWAVIHRREISNDSIRRFFRAFGIIIVIALAINSFWIIGIMRGGSGFTVISGQDFQAFPTQTDPTLGPWFNVLSLYGFWSSDYILPKDGIPVWWMATLVFLIFALAGVYRSFKKREPMQIAACLIFIPAWLLAVGYASGFTTHIVDWAAGAIVGFKGLRETEKFAGLMAFSYALLIAEGGAWFAGLIGSAKKDRVVRRGLYVVVAIFIALSVYSMPLAFNGQVVAADYPASWYQARQIITADDGTGSSGSPPTQVLVFPWEAYLPISFANYHDIANPAGPFFGDQAIVSADTGNPSLALATGSSTPQGLWNKYAFNIVQGIATVDETVPFLNAQHVGYILLIKEPDWQRYESLEQNQHLSKVLVSPELELFKLD